MKGSFMKRMRLILPAVALVLAACQPLSVTTSEKPIDPWGLPVCAVEDGSVGELPCLWDAGKSGNKAGRSYWLDVDGDTHYLAPSGASKAKARTKTDMSAPSEKAKAKAKADGVTPSEKAKAKAKADGVTLGEKSKVNAKTGKATPIVPAEDR